MIVFKADNGKNVYEGSAIEVATKLGISEGKFRLAEINNGRYEDYKLTRSYTRYICYLKGKKVASAKTLVKLAEMLGYGPVYLYERVRQKRPFGRDKEFFVEVEK